MIVKIKLKFLKKKDLSCLQIGSSTGLDTKDFFNFKEKNFLIDVIDLNILTDKIYENINFIKKDFFKFYQSDRLIKLQILTKKN